MTAKDTVRALLDRLPNDCSLEDVQYHLMRMSRIRFEAGARTNWHLHSTGQLLLVEEGPGRLQELGDRVVELRAGQPVYTKPNVKHWHGASPNEAAVQFSVYSGTLEWLEAVSDADYLGPGR